jgi:hypothetical protein
MATYSICVVAIYSHGNMLDMRRVMVVDKLDLITAVDVENSGNKFGIYKTCDNCRAYSRNARSSATERHSQSETVSAPLSNNNDHFTYPSTKQPLPNPIIMPNTHVA